MKQLNGITIIVVVALLVVLVAVGFVNAIDRSSTYIIENIEEANFILDSASLDDFEGINFGASGTRFPNGISADSTSPSSGEVRGTTLTSTGAATLASGSVTGAWTVSGFLYGDTYSTSTNSALTLTADQSGSVNFFDTTGATTTLPAVTNTGARFIFSIQTAFDTSSMVIASAEGDNINGSLFVNDAIVACSGEDYINFIEDGEAIGDFVELISDGTNWNILNSRGEAAAKLTCTDPS